MSWEGLVMTLNKSLFSFGIFKNTIYRFKWGSLLYFVALFFSVPFMLLVADFDRLVGRVAGSSFYIPTSIILRGDYLTVPLLLAVVVPTAVAVLVFNNVHSSKQGIFTHGLPCGRRANYISNLAAGFVLMSLPVLLNGAILMVMSFGRYGQIFSSMSVIYWIGLNLNMLFVMFSFAVFSAFLTGNIAAHIGINAFLHVVPMAVAWAIYIISDKFLFGFFQSENFIANELINNTPIVWLFGRSLSHRAIFAKLQTWVYVVGAAAVYVLGYLLYKNRKIEACGDVAAFKVFKPILKYAVVAAVAIAVFGILAEMDMGAVAVFVVAIVLTAITYFAAEMLMSKTFKVFKSSYKGYLGFAVFCAVFIGFFAYTGVFGYETKVPKPEDIESAAVYYNRADVMTFDDTQLIEDTLNIHKDVIKNIPVVDDYWDSHGNFRHMLVSYKLKNGGILQRRYKVLDEVFCDAMDKMYRSKEYKLHATRINDLNIDKIDGLTLSSYCGDFSYNISLNEDASDLMAAIKKDVEELSYREMERNSATLHMGIHFSCTAKENEKLMYFKEAEYEAGTEDYEYAVKSFNIDLNPSFKNAYAFLKEKGYYAQIVNQLGQSLVICKKPFHRAGNIYSYKGDTGDLGEFLIASTDFADISAEEERQLAETLALEKMKDMPEGKIYMVYTHSRDLGGTQSAMEYVRAYKAEELPDYLKKYVEQ